MSEPEGQASQTTVPQRPGPVAIVAALVLPLLVIALGLYGMERLRTFADEREEQNAGKVINGKVVEGGVVAMIDNAMQNRPEVVILGNSLSNTDIQPALLARRFGLKKHRVQRFSIPNSIGAHWYAVLKNRVYAKGYQPRMVILLSDMQSALAVTPRSEASRLNLSVQLEEDEPVIDAKLGARNYAMERVLQNRGRLRDRALTGTRNLLVDVLFHQSFERRNHRRTEKALDRVFDASKVDMRLHNNVIPIFAETKKLQPFDPEELPVPEESFLGPITELVRANGGLPVFVRPPMSPLLPPELGDRVLPEVEPWVPVEVEEHGGIYIDTRSLPFEATQFHNVDHMNDEGAKAYTEALARVLRELPGMEAYRPREGAEIDLLRFVELHDGELLAHQPPVTYRQAPPPLPRANRAVKSCTMKRTKVACWATDSFQFLSDSETLELNPAARRCSPVQVLEDGRPLPIGNVSCDEVRKHGGGRYCHSSTRMAFSSTDGTDARTNGRSYTLALDPDRSCFGSQWLYPRDHLRIDVQDLELSQFRRGVRTLTLQGAAVSGDAGVAATGALRVRLRAGDKVGFERTVTLTQLEEGVTWTLDPPLRATQRDVQLEVASNSDAFVLITSARLSGR